MGRAAPKKASVKSRYLFDMNSKERAVRFLSGMARKMAGTVPDCIPPGIMFTMDHNRMSKKTDMARLGRMKTLFVKSAVRDFGYSIRDCFNLVAAAYFIQCGKLEEARLMLSKVDEVTEKCIPAYIWEMLADARR